MKSWTYFISIPLCLVMVIVFWTQLFNTIDSGTFDSLAAWIIGGIICHGALIGICFHAYKTEIGSWQKRK